MCQSSTQDAHSSNADESTKKVYSARLDWDRQNALLQGNSSYPDPNATVEKTIKQDYVCYKCGHEFVLEIIRGRGVTCPIEHCGSHVLLKAKAKGPIQYMAR